MRRRTDYPHWTYKTSRQFRAQKRADAIAALQAIERMRQGAAFLPRETYLKVRDAAKLIEEIRDDLSVKKWGR